MCHKVALWESPAKVPARSGLSTEDVRYFVSSAAPRGAPISAPRKTPKRTHKSAILAHLNSARPQKPPKAKSNGAPRRLPRHNFITKGVKAGQVRLQTFLESGSLVQSRKGSKAGYHSISWQSQGRQNLPLCKMARSCAPL